MYDKRKEGRSGEYKASAYLKNMGYKIIDRNFFCRQGEIDIVAKDIKTNEFVFVEVKKRNSLKYGLPIEAVNKSKQKHIVYATKYYIYKNKLENEYIRFDVISIYKNCIKHYINCEFNY